MNRSIIIYQVLPRIWGNGKLSAWDRKAFDYLRGLGVDHIWYTGIPRHASGKDFVKGDPGSPYAISDWYDVNPYLADDPDRRMEEFEALVRRTHESGLKCIIDYIPNHVARDYEGDIARFGYCDADWTDTLKNDWSDPATLKASLDILGFWAGKGVDGFRCDMIELVPKEALKALISGIKAEFPELIFIGEAYDRNNYRSYIRDVGFDLLYDKSGSYDILRAVTCHGESARQLTWNWQFLGDLQPSMLNFIENHDEQRVSSPWYAGCPEKSYAALTFSMLYGPGSFMLYFGQEAGENAAEGHEGRTSIFNFCKPRTIGHICNMIQGTGPVLNNTERKVLGRYRKLLAYADLPVFREGATWDLCYCQQDAFGFNPDRHFAFLRFLGSEAYAVVCNFSDRETVMSLVIPEESLGRRMLLEGISVEAYGARIIPISGYSPV